MTADPDKPVKADIYRALSEEHEKISEATFKKAMKGWAFKGGKWVSA